MDLPNWFNNPVAESLAAYTDVIGIWFYVLLLIIIDGYVLIKTESWGAASIVAIFMAIVFSAILPAYIVYIWAIAAVFSLAAVIVDLIWLK
jgi:hypothetical protein